MLWTRFGRSCPKNKCVFTRLSGKGFGAVDVRVCSSFFYIKLAEYQGSRNKYHRHTKGDYRIKGFLSWFRYNTTGNNTLQKNGALEMYKDNYYQVKTNTITGTDDGSWAIYLDTDLNDGAGFTGYSGYNGLSGLPSKPATIAFMWILRFI